jgi:chemotaxis protein MotC
MTDLTPKGALRTGGDDAAGRARRPGAPACARRLAGAIAAALAVASTPALCDSIVVARAGALHADATRNGAGDPRPAPPAVDFKETTGSLPASVGPFGRLREVSRAGAGAASPSASPFWGDDNPIRRGPAVRGAMTDVPTAAGWREAATRPTTARDGAAISDAAPATAPAMATHSVATRAGEALIKDPEATGGATAASPEAAGAPRRPAALLVATAAADASGHGGASEQGGADKAEKSDGHGADKAAGHGADEGGAHGGGKAGGHDAHAAPAVPPLPPPDPAVEARQPRRLIRALYRLQARLGSGDATAQAAQGSLVAALSDQFDAAPDAAWVDRRNVEAQLALLLSGGDPVGAGARRARGVFGADAAIIDAGLAFARGARDAAAKLAKIEGKLGDGLARAYAALTAATLMASGGPADRAAAPALFDTARLLAPGLLPEEAALRRASDLAAREGDGGRYARLASIYLRRFPRSVYAAPTREGIAATAARLIVEPADLDAFAPLLDDLPAAETRATLETVARAALGKGRTGAALAAARALANAAGGDVATAERARVYALAGETLRGEASAATALASASAGGDAEVEALRQAALALARQVYAWPPREGAGARRKTPQTLRAPAGRDPVSRAAPGGPEAATPVGGAGAPAAGQTPSARTGGVRVTVEPTGTAPRAAGAATAGGGTVRADGSGAAAPAPETAGGAGRAGGRAAVEGAPIRRPAAGAGPTAGGPAPTPNGSAQRLVSGAPTDPAARVDPASAKASGSGAGATVPAKEPQGAATVAARGDAKAARQNAAPAARQDDASRHDKDDASRHDKDDASRHDRDDASRHEQASRHEGGAESVAGEARLTRMLSEGERLLEAAPAVPLASSAAPRAVGSAAPSPKD